MYWIDTKIVAHLSATFLRLYERGVWTVVNYYMLTTMPRCLIIADHCVARGFRPKKSRLAQIDV